MRHPIDPAWLEAQYNNRARVPEHPALFARWDAASDLALRQSLPPPQLDVAYGSGAFEVLDLFPTAAANAPVLVFIHGGYWRVLDKRDHAFLAPAFTAAGAHVVIPNYALCPQASIEQIVLQQARMLAWVWRHADAFGGDRARIALAGHSAGGHLVAMLLSCRWKELGADLPPQPVAGGLALSGLYDLEPLRHTPSLQQDLQLTAASVARLSPAFFPRPKGSARLYAVVGLDESDEYLRQTRLMRDVWGPSTVPVCETVPGRNHFTLLQDLADPERRVHELALRLLGLR